MLKFQNGGILCSDMSQMPSDFIGAARVFLDFETRSGCATEMSVNPWRFCDILSFAVTVDDCKLAYCADFRYTAGFYEHAYQYIQNLLWYADTWVNHNIKYDAHVGINYAKLQLPPWLKLRCTLTQAKIVDSDRGAARGGYGLDALSEHWLGHNINPYEDRLKLYLGRNNKDYGAIPADILGEYNCQDVLTNRDLDRYIIRRMPEECQRIADTEVKLTKLLVKLEQTGMRFDPMKMAVAQFKALNRMNTLEAELEKITGESFRPAVSKDCEKILCGKYGLPVVAYTVDQESGEETENASYNAKALALYSAMPYAPQDVIERIIEFRDLSQRNNLFFTPIRRDWPDGIFHPTYNQIVRTGRMSCSDPNAQQFDEMIASLIEPPEGYSIISSDASQIEKRLVVHYIDDKAAIKTYQDDPDADFYMLTANDCGISRSAAKTVDLGTGYGEGEKKLILQLKSNKDVIAAVKAEVEAMKPATEMQRQQLYDQLADARGKMIYKKYHQRFPTLKTTAKAAEAAVKHPSRRLGTANDNTHYYGYITNLYGRRRHIPYAAYRTDYKTKDPYDRAWLAFPTLNQSTAADLMKERFVELCEAIGDRPIYPIGLVHDEICSIAPNEVADDPRTARDMLAILESPSVQINVPIRWSYGVSRDNWLHASEKVKDGGTSAMLKYNKEEAERFAWL